MIVLVPTFKKPEQVEKCKKALAQQSFKDFDSEFREDVIGEGFTSNVNHLLKAAIQRGHYAFALVLNQDCYLHPEAIEVLHSFMLKHPRCAIAGIKQLSSTNEDQIIHGGTYECFPAGKHAGGLVSRGDCAVNKQVPWVNGACMMVRLEAIQEIGLLDKTMKMFASDADWSYTARARGWECWYVADAVCIHEQGISQSMDKNTQKVFEKDMLQFRSKWVDGDLYRDLSLEIFSEEDVCEELVEGD